MKKLLMVFSLMAVMVACGKNDKSSDTENQEKEDVVEVIYFHGKQRCATCLAIEENAKAVVETEFADEVKNGTVAFKTVDISTSEGEALADIYEVTWSSLFVNKWKDGKEVRNDMTDFGFTNARNNPDEFKRGLAETIRQSLK